MSWLRSGFFTLADRVSAMVFGFGSLFLLLRLLTKEDFGVWVLFTTVSSFVEVGRVGLLQNGLVRDLNANPPSEHPYIQTASLALSAILSVLSALLLLVLAAPLAHHWHIPQLEALLQLYAVTTLLLTPLYQFNYVQMAYLDYRGIFLANFVRQGLFFGYVAYLFATDARPNLMNMAFMQLLAAMPATLMAWFFVKKYITFSSSLHRGWLRQLFDFGKYNFGTNLATMSYKNVDKWMLESLLKAPGMVGSYELAIRISNLVEAPVFALATVFFPKSARRMAEEGIEAVRGMYEKSVGVLLALIIPFMLFIWIAAPLLVTIIGSQKYADTIPILRFTVLFGLFVPYAVQFGTTLDSIGKPRVNFYFTTLSALVNLGCNIVFIKWYGLIGAALGTLTAFAIMFVVMQYVLHRMAGTNPLRAFNHILPFYRDMFGQLRSRLGS